MVDNSASSCAREFEVAAPEKPFTTATPVSSFEPLINRIDARTQSDLFRRAGKYTSNEDVYDLAQNADANDQTLVKKSFDNGVTLEMQQSDGWPTRLTLEDKANHLSETVTLDETNHRITGDKVEFCGVSRERKFSAQGETYRAYSFEGGTITKEGSLPVLHLEQK